MILNLEQMIYVRFSTKIPHFILIQGKKNMTAMYNFLGSEWQKNHLKLQTPMICNILQMMCVRSSITFLVFEELIFLIFYSEHTSTNVCNLVPKMFVSSSTRDSKFPHTEGKIIFKFAYVTIYLVW